MQEKGIYFFVKEKDMKKTTHVITTKTVTYAMMAQRLLDGRGIPSQIVRPSAEAVARGCAYGLEIDSRYRSAARDLLTGAGIPCTV